MVSLDEDDDDEVEDGDEAADAEFADEVMPALEELSDRSNGMYIKFSYARMLTRLSGPKTGSAGDDSVS